MEGLKKLKQLIFKEGIPKHVTSGVSIHHPLGMIDGAHWGINIVIRRDDYSTTPFLLQENLLNVSVQARIHVFGIKGKFFALGNVHFAISVLHSFEMTICKKQFYHLFEENHIETRIECATKKMDPLMLEYLRNSENYLYVGGDVTLFSVEENCSNPACSADLDTSLILQNARFKPYSDLSRDIKNIFMDSIIPDLELKCGLETFQAHKAILAARSPVFLAMFQNQMKENTENEVIINDMEPQTLKAMLEYIYSGRINDFSNSSTCELLSAADRYQLLGLKDISVNFLSNDVSVNNVLRMLVYADLHDEVLKKIAMEFICKHYDYLKTTSEWLNLKLEKSFLLMEVMDFKIQSLKAS